LDGKGYATTYTSSLDLSDPSTAPGQNVTIDISDGLGYTAGSHIRLWASSSAYLEGTVTAYSNTTLTFTVDLREGAGTASNWNLNLAGIMGATGPMGEEGPEPTVNGHDGQLLYNDLGNIGGTEFYYTAGNSPTQPDNYRLGLGVQSPDFSLDVSGTAKLRNIPPVDPHYSPAGVTDWASPSITGSLVVNTGDGIIYWKRSGRILPYTFVGDGNETSFALSTDLDYTPAPGPEYYIVSVDGLMEPPENYQILVGTTASSEPITSFQDSSTHAAEIVTYGDTTHSYTEKKFGNSSIYFDGAGDFLAIAEDSSKFEFAGEFTLECWINTTTQTATYCPGCASWNNRRIMALGNNESTALQLLLWGGWNSDESSIRVGMFTKSYAVGGGSNLWMVNSTVINDGNWHHIALVRSGNVIKLYVDGSSTTHIDTVGSNSLQQDYLNSTDTWVNDTDLHIGKMPDGDAAQQNHCTNGKPYTDPDGFDCGGYWDGYIDEIRISSTARYTETTGFTPPTSVFQDDGLTELLIHSNYSTVGDHKLVFNSPPVGDIDVREIFL
jgi:hypothetical protein